MKQLKDTIFEGLTDVVYHFTTIEGIIGIMKMDAFKLADIRGKWQYNPDIKRPYYICVTRQKYGKTGYSSMRKDFLIRLTLNGRKLSERYKGIPFEYFYVNKGKTPFEIMKDRDGKITPEQGEVQNEERIVSSHPYIKDASKYIDRIDINAEKMSKEVLDEIIDLIKENNLFDKLYVYYNSKDYILQSNKFEKLTESLLDNDDELFNNTSIENKINNSFPDYADIERCKEYSYEYNKNLSASLYKWMIPTEIEDVYTFDNFCLNRIAVFSISNNNEYSIKIRFTGYLKNRPNVILGNYYEITVLGDFKRSTQRSTIYNILNTLKKHINAIEYCMNNTKKDYPGNVYKGEIYLEDFLKKFK